MSENKHTPEQSNIRGILRAMAVNYANGHSWDHLDGEACIKADEVIGHLEKQRDDLLAVIEQCVDVIAYHYGANARLTKECEVAIASVKEKK